MIGHNNAMGAKATDLATLSSKVSEVENTANTALATAEAAAEALSLSNTIFATPSQSGTLTYTGAAQEPSWYNYDSTALTIGGVTSATNAGEYTATFTPTEEYQWSDGTQATINVTWSIGRAVISITPSQSGTLTYTGSEQTAAWSNYDSSKLTIGGTTSATNAGEYTATFTPTSNYQWSDESTDAKNATWSIGKASGSASVSPTALSVSAGETGTITVTRAGDGAVSAVSNNTGVATVSVSDNVVTVVGVEEGTATITITVAEGTSYYAVSDSMTVSITITESAGDEPSSVLNENTPAVIQSVAQAGVAANYWSVGDKIGIALSGTVGELELDDTYYAFIIGFDHNSTYEGSNTIHFQFGKTSDGTDIAFVDSLYSSYDTTSTDKFKMNTTNTNSGGWESCTMRTARCAEFLSAMPSEWQTVISPCTKYTDNVGAASGNVAENVTATQDSVWLLAELEVQGARSYANTYEASYQAQYTYYANGNSKIKYKHSDTATACYWWLRSVFASVSTVFCYVNTGGSASASSAYTSRGFAPGFKVA